MILKQGIYEYEYQIAGNIVKPSYNLCNCARSAFARRKMGTNLKPYIYAEAKKLCKQFIRVLPGK